MLYNPDWERVFTLESFSAWLSQKPKNERYCFLNLQNCAAAQYLKANGLDPMISTDRLKELGWTDVVCSGGRNETFGYAARRAQLILRGGWQLRAAKFFGVAGLV